MRFLILGNQGGQHIEEAFRDDGMKNDVRAWNNFASRFLIAKGKPNITFHKGELYDIGVVILHAVSQFRCGREGRREEAATMSRCVE